MSEQSPPVTIPDTEMRTLSSSYIDHEYNIFVALPAGYAGSEETYPALYTTDADLIFGTITQLTRLLALGKEVPPLVIVGIGYPTTWTETQPYRARDYIPDVSADPSLGGAELFLRFITDDLIPFVDSEYRVDPGDRCLVGNSLGGVFALYALLTHPEIFSRFLIGSPWMVPDLPDLFSFETDYATDHTDLPARVFMAAGSQEPEFVVTNTRRMAETLQARRYDRLKLTTRIFEGETHASVIPYNLTGLAVLYE